MISSRVSLRAKRFGVAVASVLFVGLASFQGRAAHDGDGFPLRSVVALSATVSAEARTARSLGTRRAGHGVVIGSDGLILTIGYLILEASAVQVEIDGKTVPAAVVAYDHDTGFGLVRASLPSHPKPVRLGDSSKIEVGTEVLVAGHGGIGAAIQAVVASRRTFAGYWEYMLEQPIFTVPPHPTYGGAALFGGDGRLLGIGSLIVNNVLGDGNQLTGNMFVPINELKPILADLLEHGRRSGPRRPWLGIYTAEARGHIFVNRVAAGGPAQKAGIKTGDIILGVGGKRVAGLAEFYRGIWAAGAAGTDVLLNVLAADATEPTVSAITVISRARHQWLKTDRGL